MEDFHYSGTAGANREVLGGSIHATTCIAGGLWDDTPPSILSPPSGSSLA